MPQSRARCHTRLLHLDRRAAEPGSGNVTRAHTEGNLEVRAAAAAAIATVGTAAANLTVAGAERSSSLSLVRV